MDFLTPYLPPPLPSSLSPSLSQFRGGPISVAEYMSQVLTSEHAGGFYMTRDVFGVGGDFITSPDISQMFGEVRRNGRCQDGALAQGDD